MDEGHTLRRKRFNDGECSVGESPADKRLRLSTANLELFDRESRVSSGSPDGFKPTQPDSASDSVSDSASTQPSLRPEGYGLHPDEEEVLRYGILPPWESKTEPSNIATIRDRLNQARGSPEPSEAEFKLYSRRIKLAPNNTSVMAQFMPLFFNQFDTDPLYSHAAGMEMDNFDFPAHLGPGCVLDPPKPDVVQGLRQPSFPSLSTAEADGALPFKYQEVGASVEPMAFPTLTGRFTGFGYVAMSAAVMCAYDAAALMYARNTAVRRVKVQEPKKQARVMSFVSHGETIRIFAHFTEPGPTPDKYVYHMYPVSCTKFRVREDEANDPAAVAEAYDQFLVARRLLRNAQDISRTEAYYLRNLLAIRNDELRWYAQTERLLREEAQRRQRAELERRRLQEVERRQREEAERQRLEAVGEAIGRGDAPADTDADEHLESVYSFVDEDDSDEDIEEWDEDDEC